MGGVTAGCRNKAGLVWRVSRSWLWLKSFPLLSKQHKRPRLPRAAFHKTGKKAWRPFVLPLTVAALLSPLFFSPNSLSSGAGSHQRGAPFPAPSPAGTPLAAGFSWVCLKRLWPGCAPKAAFKRLLELYCRPHFRFSQQTRRLSLLCSSGGTADKKATYAVSLHDFQQSNQWADWKKTFGAVESYQPITGGRRLRWGEIKRWGLQTLTFPEKQRGSAIFSSPRLFRVSQTWSVIQVWRWWLGGGHQHI